MKILPQIAVVFCICLAGEALSSVLPFPFPGSVIAMILLFVLLLCGAVKVRHIREKADFLLKNMAFFFVPAGVNILDNYQFIEKHVAAFLFICIVSTVLTFAAVAFTVRGIMFLQNRRSDNTGKNTADSEAG